MSWWEIARAQGGVITHEQLLEAGASSGAIHRMRRSGELLTICRGVYLGGSAPATYLARLWAAQLATDGVLSQTTAGRLWGVYDGTDQLVHVDVGPDRRIARPRGVRVRRRALPPDAVGERSGLRVTTRTWTIVDLLATLPRSEAVRLADRAVQRRWITADDCLRRLRDHANQRGNGQLRVVAAKLGDGAAAESERRLHALLRRAGVRGWVPNLPVWHNGELVGIVDVALPKLGVAIEVDGMAYHVDVDRFRADRTKQNALVALGWTVLRFTWADLTERPGYVVAMVRRAAA